MSRISFVTWKGRLPWRPRSLPHGFCCQLQTLCGGSGPFPRARKLKGTLTADALRQLPPRWGCVFDSGDADLRPVRELGSTLSDAVVARPLWLTSCSGSGDGAAGAGSSRRTPPSRLSDCPRREEPGPGVSSAGTRRAEVSPPLAWPEALPEPSGSTVIS